MKGLGGRPDHRATTNRFEAGPPQRASQAQASGSSLQPLTRFLSWQSAPARYGVDIEDLIRQNQHNGVGTSITRTREELLTFDVDTDSDSDAELPHPNLTVFTTPR